MAACRNRQPVEDEIMNIELSPKKLDLSSAIAEGDIRVLLMVLVHMTGDEKWLEPPYKPKRDVRLIPDPDAGVPKEIQEEIRAAVVRLFENGAPEPVITDPGNELILKMMRATLGENVAQEYAPLMREEMGFVPREARWRSVTSASPTPSSRRTTSWAGPGMSTAIPAAASIRRTIPTRFPLARGIP